MRLIPLILILIWFKVEASTTNLITQWGIEWYFDSSVEYGTFVNGDYWVVAPVTITNMTPAWDGAYNGWEINPTVAWSQGFVNSGGLASKYSASLRTEMPLTLTTNCSLVKTIGGTTASSQSLIHTAAVLTVLSSALDSTNYFRPPYVGTNKPLYQITDLQTNLLPTLASVDNTPTLATVVSNFSKCLRMDHHYDTPRWLRPSGSMGDYQPANTPNLNEAMLRLMLDDSGTDKLPALILFTQHTIDQAYAILLGYRRLDGGHNPNHRILAAWAATLLDIDEIKTCLATADGFHEDYYLSSTLGIPVWGSTTSEWFYWKFIMGLSSTKDDRDPYGYIDGGALSSVGAAYQNIVSQSFKGQALIYRLFPELTNCIPVQRWTNLNQYAERWVTNGVWATPDPAAPYDGTNANFGITFGTNGAGGYIAGSGRYPQYHGANKDGGQYKSLFVASMWDAYADGGEPTPVTTNGPSVTITTPNEGQSFVTNATITLTCTPVNGTGTITNIAWSVNGTLLVNATNSSFSTNAIGSYELQAVATDDNGLTGGGSVNVTVVGGSHPPQRIGRWIPISH